LAITLIYEVARECREAFPESYFKADQSARYEHSRASVTFFWLVKDSYRGAGFILFFSGLKIQLAEPVPLLAEGDPPLDG
jgi:hypothetical protein